MAHNLFGEKKEIYDAVSNLTIQLWTVRWQKNDEQKRIWKEVLVA